MLFPIVVAAMLAHAPSTAALPQASPIVALDERRSDALLQHPTGTSEFVQSFTIKGHAARKLQVHNTHGREEWETDDDGRIFLPEQFVRNGARLFVVLADGTKVAVRLRLDDAGGLNPIELTEALAGVNESTLATAFARLSELVLHHMVASAILAVALALGVWAWKRSRAGGGGEGSRT